MTIVESKRILIVEDEPIVAADIKQMVEGWGCRAVLASSSTEAVEGAVSDPPDMVLMDISLEGPVDGIDTAKMLRDRFNPPIVYLTAYADRETLERAGETAPHHYVVKPFRERELRAAIEMALHRHHLETELRDTNARLEQRVEERTSELERANQVLRHEVRQRRRTEDALRESEAQFRAHYELLPIPTFTWRKMGEDFVLVEFNSAALEFTKGKVKDLLGRRASEVLRHRPEVLQDLRACREEQRLVRREIRYQPETGDRFWDLDVTYVRVPPDMVVVYTLDISVRRHYERELRHLNVELERRVVERTAKLEETQRRYYTLFDESPDAVIVADARNGRLLELNQAALDMLGFSASAPKGLTLADLDVSLATGEIQEELIQLASIGSGEVEATVRRRDRVVKHTIWRSRTVDLAGCPTLHIIVQDVTARRAAEKALAEREAWLRAVLESMAEGLVSIDDQGTIVNYNDAAAGIFGFRPPEVIGKEIGMLMPSPHREQHQGYLESHHRTGEARAIGEAREVYGRRKDGSVFPVSINVRQLDHAGERFYIATVQDITERKAQEEKLRLSDDILKAMANIVMVGDANGSIRYVSPSTRHVLGYEPKELLGEAWWKLTRDDPEESDRERERITRMVAGEMPVDVEYETVLKRRGGEKRVILWRNSPGPDGLVIGVGHDVTARRHAEEELRKSEARLREAQRIAHLGHWEWFLSTNETWYSEEVYRIFGRSKEEFGSTFESFLDCVHPEDQEMIKRKNDRALSQAENYRIDHRIVLPDGTVRVVHQEVQVSFDEFGDPIKMTGTVQDITERKQAEDELGRSRAQLRRLAQRLEEVREEERWILAREIHDELGQALTGIKMDISWIGHRLADDDREGEQRVHALSQLVDSTIDTIRRIAWKLRPSVLDDLGLEAAVEWALDEFGKRVDMEYSLLIENLDLDRNDTRAVALFRVLQEALTNVMRHSDARKLEVSLRRDHGEIVLKIDDDGQGTSVGDPEGPTAIGILGMKERTLAVGGTFEFDSAPGTGTHVTVTVPVAKGEAL